MEQFYQLRRRAGYADIKQCAAFLGVTRQTIARWDRDQAPTHVITLMQLLCKELDWISPAWRGFSFYNVELRGPDNERITPGDIRAYPHLLAAVEAHEHAERKRREYRKRWKAWFTEGECLLKETFRRAWRVPRLSMSRSLRSRDA